MWAENSLDTDEDFEHLREAAIGGTRVFVIAGDSTTAQKWAKARNMPGGHRSPKWVNEASMLFGATDDGLTAIVVVQGATTHKRWKQIKTQVSVHDAGGIPVYYDRQADAITPRDVEARRLAGAFVGSSLTPQWSDDGVDADVFVLRAGGSQKVTILRGHIDDLVDLLRAWQRSEEPRDPVAELTKAIVDAVVATGDPYASPA